MQKIGILDPDGNELNPLSGKPYSEQYITLAKKWSALPAYKHADEIIKLIEKNQVILIISSTGSGKTVLLPKYALHAMNYKSKIVVTMPKQIIVKAAAEYASATLDVTLGEEVGFQYRGESLYGPNTKIMYATDGTLVAQFMKDPLISMYDIVIIDEAHERKIQIDLLLFLIKNALQKRPELKLIIMSATINEKIFADYYKKFSYASFNVPGERIFPIQSIFTQDIVPISDYLKVGYKIIKNIISNDDITQGNSHDILFFVPSIRDTFKLCEMINRDKLDIYCVKIFSGIDKEEQYIAQDKSKYKDFGKSRKLVMATNVAESSITIDGIKYVIDSGLEYISSYDPELRARQLEKKMITIAQAKQRMGRAGRIEPGICYHLYTEDQFNKKMRAFPEPEIRTGSLLDESIKLLQLNITNNLTLLQKVFNQFIEPPYSKYVSTAIEQMNELELVNKSGKPTDLCKLVTELGLGANISIALIAGYRYECYREVLCIYILIELCHGKIINIFNKPSDKAEQSIRNKFRGAFFSFKDPTGDHISVLNIIHKFFKLHTKESFQNDKEIFEWCRANFLNYDLLKNTYKRYKSVRNRLGEILQKNKDILKKDIGLFSDEETKKKSVTERVLCSIYLGFRNQIAQQKGSMYYTPHCKKTWDINRDSYFSELSKQVIYHEIFISGNQHNINIVSKI